MGLFNFRKKEQKIQSNNIENIEKRGIIKEEEISQDYNQKESSLIIQKYLSENEISFLNAILDVKDENEKNKYIYSLENSKEIQEYINFERDSLGILEKERRKAKSFEQIKAHDDIITRYEYKISFLQDSEKLIKLIKREEPTFSYLDIFNEIFKQTEELRIDALEGFFEYFIILVK